MPRHNSCAICLLMASSSPCTVTGQQVIGSYLGDTCPLLGTEDTKTNMKHPFSPQELMSTRDSHTAGGQALTKVKGISEKTPCGTDSEMSQSTAPQPSACLRTPEGSC